MVNYFIKIREKWFFEAKQQREIIHDIHEGIGQNFRSKAMAVNLPIKN